MQDFRKLRVWSLAQELAVELRRATRRFPKAGYSSLQNQLIRAAESVVLNIVEGCGASSPKDFARFLEIAIKSTSEVEGNLDLSRQYGILSENDWKGLVLRTVDVRRMAYGLRKRVLAASKTRDA